MIPGSRHKPAVPIVTPMRTHPTMSEYLAGIYHGKVQKIAVNAGLGCPNRDGRCGTGGCVFCNNAAFSPRYASECGGSITEQLAAGVQFFSRSGRNAGYLPYFQTYSNTYGETQHLIDLYEEALGFPGAVGLVIATRPDCLAEDLLGYFEERFGSRAPAGHPHLLLEVGVESTDDRTLRSINRGHDFACAETAVRELALRGIDVGVHLILGLPGESDEDFMLHADRISELPVKTLKLHHLQVIEGTPLAEMYRADPGKFHLFTPEEYAHVVRSFLDRLRADIAVDRLVSETPKGLVIAPAWGLKPSEFQEIYGF